MYSKITPKEKQWIEDCEKLMKRMLVKLWLFNGSGDMTILKTPVDGSQMLPDSEGGGVDPSNIVSCIICNTDGGDW